MDEGGRIVELEAVRAAVTALRVPSCGEAIVEARAVRDALDARIADAEAAYTRSSQFEVEGFGSMAAFLCHRCRMTDSDARRTATRARRLAVWPGYLEAWQTGTVTGAQVDATVAVVPDTHVERFAATDSDTAAILGPLDLGDTRHALRAWVERAAAVREAAEEGIEAPAPDRHRELFLARTLGDVTDLRGLLDPDSATVVAHALTAAEKPDVDGERRTPARRRADALVDVCRFYNDHLTDGPNRRLRRLTVIADIRVLYRAALRGAGVTTAAHLEQFLHQRPRLGPLERGLFADAFDGHGGTARTLAGNPISDGLISCISSDGTLERLLTADSRIIDHGRSVRAFTHAQRRAVLARDQGCRRAGCDRPAHHCSIHHVQPWEAGGRTDLANAVAKCDHDHHEDHRRGCTDHIDPDGTYTITTPTGTTHTTRPPAWHPPPALPVTTTAEPARPLPFDPTPIGARPAVPTRHHPPAGPPPEPPDTPEPTDATELTQPAQLTHSADSAEPAAWADSAEQRFHRHLIGLRRAVGDPRLDRLPRRHQRQPLF